MFQGTVSQLVEKYRFRLMMTVMVALLDHAAADFAVVVDSPDGLAVGFDNRAVFVAAAVAADWWILRVAVFVVADVNVIVAAAAAAVAAVCVAAVAPSVSSAHQLIDGMMTSFASPVWLVH